jgi:hypothetical protein
VGAVIKVSGRIRLSSGAQVASLLLVSLVIEGGAWGALQPQGIAAALSGVWQGTIGRSPIVACFQPSEPQGNYYYVRFGQSLELSQAGDRADWSENSWQEGSSTGSWHLESMQRNAVRGRWTEAAKHRELPLRLSRVPLNGEDVAQSCRSAAYGRAYYQFVKKSLRKTFVRAGLSFRVVELKERKTVQLLELADPSDKAPGLRLALERIAQSALFGVAECVEPPEIPEKRTTAKRSPECCVRQQPWES